MNKQGHEGFNNWNVGVFGGSGALCFFWILNGCLHFRGIIIEGY